ncbi:MAG: 5,6-dimethylbenzimidazole synthase [Beijerinckiaceae bacterium]|nr:5,6-dimethylbenzimidazole synthase [Beijerinckiaceae bacterium]
MTSPAPHFDDAFRGTLEQLLVWRRDVRHFRTDSVPAALIDRLLDLAQLSPSVGNSQPWRWIDVRSNEARSAVRESFLRCNAEALAMQPADRRGLYARLKLAGLEAAPRQFAVCCETETGQGHGLGRRTMPEMLEYSAVSSIFTFWLAARSVGLGVGWVSILDRAEVEAALHLPTTYRLVAYLCVGWPQEDHADPELERLGWQERTSAGRQILLR